MDVIRLRCVNCSLKVIHRRRHSLQDATEAMLNILSAWISPTPVSSDDVLCFECFQMLWHIPEGEPVPPPMFGHRSVCYGCGISILRARTHLLKHNFSVRNVIIGQMSPHLVPYLTRVCHTCWRSAGRKCQNNIEPLPSPERNGLNKAQILHKKGSIFLTMLTFDLNFCNSGYQSQKILLADKAVPSKLYCQDERKRRLSAAGPSPETSDQTRDAITSPGVSQCDKDLVESEAPQTNTNAPEDMIECTYSSSTESALSDEDDPSTFTTYEEPKSSKNDDNHKPKSDQAAIETTATTQHSEVNRIVELELEEEVQSRAYKSNTQTTDEMKGREEIIEQYKCYRIIANVYHYLNEEYEWLKRQSGALYDVSALSDIPARTAAAAGVSRHSVARALRHHRTRAAVRADHTYGKGIASTNTTRTKSKMAGFSVRMRTKGGTQSHTLKKKQENDGNDGERVRPSKKRTTKSSNRNKPRDMEQLLSKNRQSKGSVPSRKRPTNKEVHDGENMGPPKRRSTRISIRSKPCEEEQLPFPSPIQLRVHGVMETEYKTEPADDECPPAIGDDPLETESWSHHPHCEPHCEQALTTEETETLFKTEPADDNCLEDLKPDPLELESSAALEEPSDSPDTTQLEVKFECVDEDMDMSKDYSIFDQTPLDIKPEPPE
ncbi:unnamed protein product [Arctia plantaginis]|uniref:Uncharacterized protein n=1 Tax=Arctia plantaginis TaxID=874455 RepID=A0A8S1BQR2_ARCPL|nr:unnamed protein product [Arctia plantaginis]